MADSGSGTKFASTMPRPEMLLTEAWLWHQKEVDRRRNDRNRPGQDGKLLHGGKRGSVFLFVILIFSSFGLFRPENIIPPTGGFFNTNRGSLRPASACQNRISGPLNV